MTHMHHALIPQANNTCKSPWISAQNLQLPDTPVQTQGFLLSGKSILEFAN